MTRPRDHAITLDPDLVFRFAAYLNRLDLGDGDPPVKDWGVFYSSAGDRTWAPVAPWGPDAAPHWTPLERELATLYDQLTPSQRRRLCQRAEATDAEALETWRQGEPRTRHTGEGCRCHPDGHHAASM